MFVLPLPLLPAKKHKTVDMYPSKLVSGICLLSTLFCITVASSTSKLDQLSYDSHCRSFVPRADPVEPTTVPLPINPQGYFLGGDDLRPNSSDYYYSPYSRKQFYFRTEYVHETSDVDVYKIEAGLNFESQGYVTHHVGGIGYTEMILGPSEFELEGFWSRSTGKLCMVGSTSATSSEETKHQSFDVLLKLSGVKSSCDITSLITGTLESLLNRSTSFNSIPLLMFPQGKCEDTKHFRGLPAEIDVPKEFSLSLPQSKPICSLFSYSTVSLELEYASGCKHSKSCNPSGASLGYLPQVMSLSIIQCSEDKQQPSFLVEFPNSSYAVYERLFNTSRSMVARGAWDATKRQLFAVACRILGSASSFDGARVDDCSVMLSLRFPATWSIGNTSSIVGYIWSKKKKSDSGYFDRIKFRSSRMEAFDIKGLKYNYTMVDTAALACQKKKPQAKGGNQYPEARDYGMQFSMSIKNPKGQGSSWGYSVPIFVGDQPWNRNSMGIISVRDASSQVEAKAPSNPVNISYQITFTSYDESSRLSSDMIITAEGTYDAGTGSLCMIGCRNSDANTTATEPLDCQILVNIQFSPMNSDKPIQGKIESTRENSDPHFFQPISFSALPYYSYGATIWRMDFEIIMALVSNTLVCVFVACQILYMKRHPNVLPFMSLVMLLVLTLGQMIPLVLNFEALFFSRQNRRGFISSYGGWVEINEVFVRVIIMVAFLLQFRLLQLVFSSRIADGNQKASWMAEKKTLYVCLPLYVAGGLIAFLVNRKKYGFGEIIGSRRRFYRNHRSLWNDSTSYAGLILDGFLLPQVLFNIFQSSREHALSNIFYLGTTFVRLVPHVYDLYRARHFMDSGSYMYADPGADFYSSAWDVTILLVGLLLASLTFLQQRFGGRCFLPKKFKRTAEYEKLPVESSDA